MRTFNKLCKAVSAQAKGHYCYNWGVNYIGITFNTYEQMHEFMKTPEYRELRPYRILSRYTKYLYFESNQ